MKKDVIYIDVEDDITAIIEKLKGSKAKIVALVPPKRSIVLLSAVNARLLKRAAEDSQKRVVLITNDSALLMIAGGLGLHIAKNLQSKPYLPEAPEVPSGEDTVIEGDLSDLDPKTMVGDLAGGAVVAESVTKTADQTTGKAKKSDEAGKKLFKIPNFERFRLKLILGSVGAVLLAATWWWAFWIAPEADINISAQTSRLETVIDYTVDTKIESSDLEEKILKGIIKEMKRTVTTDFEATGEANVGFEASGDITVRNCDSSTVITVPAGTAFTSSGGLNFFSTAAVDVPGGTFDGGGCSTPGTALVTVVAAAAGGHYNLAAGTAYSISGFGNFVSGVGEQLAGGTDEIEKVVSQEDFDKAKADLDTRDYFKERGEMTALFGDGLVAMEGTFEFSVGEVTSVPAVGEAGERAVLSAEITFTEVGVSKGDLQALLKNFQELEIDTSTQSIYDNGLSDASYELQQDPAEGQFGFRLRTVGIIGPNIDISALAEQISGKRFSEAKSIIDEIPGVVGSEIKLSPFWVNKVPGVSKTTIVVEVSEQSPR